MWAILTSLIPGPGKISWTQQDVETWVAFVEVALKGGGAAPSNMGREKGLLHD